MPGDRHPYRDSWSMRGAHLLLQVRTEVLNGDLRKTFEEWYPQMAAEPTETRLAA